MDCWVQIHNASFDYHTEVATKDFSTKLGSFKSFDKRDLTEKYIRIKVGLKIEVLLRPRLSLIQDDLHDLKLLLVYKKIPDFCYYCGIIGHEIIDCEERFKDKERGLPVDAIQAICDFGKNMREKNNQKYRNEP